MTARPLVPLVLALGACATAPEQKPLGETQLAVKSEPELINPPPATMAGPQFDPKTFASQAYTPGECASRAKDLYQQSNETGWRALRACVERGTFPRGNFTDLRGVLNGPWMEEVPKLSEAPAVFAKLVALRGGDVDGDLKTIQTARVPLFSLAAALAQPEVYKGRHLLVRAEIQNARTKADGQTMRLVEQTLQGKLMEGEVAGDRKGRSSSSKRDYNAQAQGSYRGYNASGSYAGSAQASGSLSVRGASDTRDTVTRTTYDNELSTTGRISLGRLSQPDPFLEPGKSYVFLVRFDGVRKAPGEDEEAEQVGLVSIVSYYPPAAMLVD